ncbi:MAG: S8 family serine peptidase, partial [Bacteroidia bacterium]
MKAYKTYLIWVVLTFTSCMSVNGQQDFHLNLIDEDDRFNLSSEYLWNDGEMYDASSFVLTTHNDQTDKNMETVFYEDGTVLWSNTYDNGGDDYGVKILCDKSNGFVYTIGTSFKTGSNLDLIIRKFKASDGTVEWTSRWDAGNNLDEIPVDAELINGDLFITGLANHGSPESHDDDIFVINISNGEGGIIWSYVYDYAGYDENPIGFGSTSSDIYVAGSSYENSSTRSIVLMKFSQLGGVPTVIREASGKIEYATGLKVQANDVYLVGRKFNGLDYDATIFKYNSSLILQWIYTFDYQERDDRGMNLFIQDETVHFFAECKDVNNGTASVLLQLAKNTGTLQNVSYFEPTEEQGSILLRNIHVRNDFSVAVFAKKDNTNIVKACFVVFYKGKVIRNYFDNSQSNFFLNGASIYDNSMVLYGIKNYSSTYKSEVKFFNFQFYETAYDVIIDSIMASDSTYIDTGKVVNNRIEIMFSTDSLKSAFTDNVNVEFGKINEVFTAATSKIIDSLLDYPDSAGIIKIFPDYTSSDTLDTNYYGGVFRTQNYYAKFYLIHSQFENLDELQSKLSQQNFVEYTSLDANLIPNGLDPDDELYDDFQFALHKNTSSTNWHSAFTNGNINIQSAWDITTGDPNVKVAVVEGPVCYKHEDFSYDHTLANSVVKPSPKYSTYTNWSDHGTRVAGVIGALNNNGIGVASVAGGSGSADGVSLFSYGKGDHLITSQEYLDLLKADVHVINQSWYMLEIWGDPFPTTHSDRYIDLIKKGVILVTSRGNDRYQSGNFDEYPSKFFPLQSISVGAHGNDGTLLKPHNNRGWYDPGGQWADGNKRKYWSKYGGELDFLAPGWVSPYDNIIDHLPEVGCYTTDFVDATNLDYDDYSTATQTSTSTPHIAGLAGLLISGHFDHTKNANTLTVEDIEKLIAMSCVDIKASDEDNDKLNADHDILKRDETHEYYRPMPEDGFDELTGWGKVNAAKAVYYSGIKVNGSSDFDLLHYDQDDTEISITQTTSTPLFNGNLQEVCLLNSPDKNKIDKKVKAYKVTITIEVDIPSGYVIFDPWWFTKSGEKQGGIWQNSVISNMKYPIEEVNVRKSNFDIIYKDLPYLMASDLDVTNSTVKLTGYVYEIVEEKINGTWQAYSGKKWFPFNPSNAGSKAKFGITLHVVKSSVGYQEMNGQLNFDVYPNPVFDKCY